MAARPQDHRDQAIPLQGRRKQRRRIRRLDASRHYMDAIQVFTQAIRQLLEQCQLTPARPADHHEQCRAHKRHIAAIAEDGTRDTPYPTRASRRTAALRPCPAYEQVATITMPAELWRGELHSGFLVGAALPFAASLG